MIFKKVQASSLSPEFIVFHPVVFVFPPVEHSLVVSPGFPYRGVTAGNLTDQVLTIVIVYRIVNSIALLFGKTRRIDFLTALEIAHNILTIRFQIIGFFTFIGKGHRYRR